MGRSSGAAGAGPFLLELAEAAAEALRLLERGALRLEPAEPGFELAHVRAAPPVLTLVQLPLALGEKLLARRDRVGMVGELAARPEERLLHRAQLVEAGLDLGKACLVGIARDPLSLLDRPLPRLDLASGPRAPSRAVSSAEARSARAESPFADASPERSAVPAASAASRAATTRSRSASAAARVASRSESGSTRGGSWTPGACPACTRVIAARSSSSRSFTAATRSASWRFMASSAARCSASAWRSCATGSSLSARRTST